MADRGKTDWDTIKVEFQAGKRAIRQIAKRHGVSDTAVRKRAKACGWVRTTANQAGPADLAPPPASQVIIPPRKPRGDGGDGEDGARVLALGEDLAHRLLGELDVATSCQDEIEAAIYAETAGDENGQRRALMLKAVSLPARALTLKTLAQAVAILKDVGQGADKGKKQQRQDNAEKSAAGRFAPPAPPKLVVNNRS